MMRKIKWHYVVMAFLVLISFFLFAPLFTHNYCSDKAVHVLMAYDFKFPNDLYYWGQDRLGSILPLLSSIPVKWLNCSPVVAVSIVQYLMLAGGFMCFGSFIKKPILQIALCLIWFFPLAVFNAHLQIGHPYAGQLFLLGLSLLCFNKQLHSVKGNGKHLYAFMSTFCFMMSAWVHDIMLFVLPVFLIFVVASLTLVASKGSEINFSVPLKLTRSSIFLLLGILAGGMFLMFAKSEARLSPPDYDILFSNVSEIKQGFSGVMSIVVKALGFKVRNVLISFHAVFCLALLLLVSVHFILSRKIEPGSKYRAFIFCSAVLTFMVITSSHWVAVNVYDTRYFSFTYFLLVIFLIMSIDVIPHRHWSAVSVTFALLAGSLSAADAVAAALHPANIPKHLTVEQIDEISQELGSCGIIGDYWTSYNLASVHPDQIIASPRDHGMLRNTDLIPELMAKEKIYLVKENWLAEFPSSCIQFGYFLQRAGEPFTTHGMTLCQYKNVDHIRLPLDIMLHRNMHVQAKEDTCLVKNDSTKYVNDFIFYGPFITLRPGVYTFRADIGTFSKGPGPDTLMVDFTNSMGQTVFMPQTFVFSGNTSCKQGINMKFEVKTPLRAIEMRGLLKGRAQVYLDKMDLRRE